MSNFTIYNSDSTEIRYECDNQQNLQRILKFCSYKNCLYLLNCKFELFYGTVDKNYVKFRLFKQNIIDIEIHDDQFYIIDENGCVHKAPVIDIEVVGAGGGVGGVSWKEIVVPNPKTCPHGFKSITEKVRISRINCNNDGLLLTSFNNELYGMGNFSEVLQSDYPIRVECFSGLKILQVTTGDNFAVILTAKRTDPNDFDYENSSIYDDIKDTFISSECPKCPSHKIHPNKNVSKSTTETSMASSSSGTFDSDENQKNIEALNKVVTPIKSNKDLAINFFLESLSILSEDFIEGGKQTKLVKENVSNITSMVYEGVKTLSRHMSGSDNNDTPPLESFEIVDDSSSLKNENYGFGTNSAGMSLSETSSLDNDEFDIHSEVGLEKNINDLCRIGNSLLTTGVWSFGSVNREGQLGTGDQVKRNIIIPVLKLQGQGVVKISSGKNHSIALTIDGRLYLWGSNFSKQISCEQYDQYSSPKLYKNKEKVIDSICSDYSTIILLNNLNIIEENNKPNIRDQSISSSSFEIVKNSDCTNNSNIVNFLCSEQYLLINHNVFKPIINYLTAEQKYLHDLLHTYNTIIKPFIRKIQFITPQNQLYDNLINLYLNIIYLTIINCKTVKEYYLMHITCTQILFVKNLNELIKLYRNYLKKFTNLLCINAFDNLKMLLDKKLIATNNTTTSNLNIKKIFEFPLLHIVNYKNFLSDLKKYEFELNNFLADKQKYFDKFLIEIDMLIGDSMKTLNFWKTADKLLVINDLYEPERRVILDSKDVSLKLNGPTMSLLSQRFILFTDYLCYLTSNQLYKYQLTTLWVETIQKYTNNSSSHNSSGAATNNSGSGGNDSKQRNLLKIITPENHIIVVTKSHEDKIKWLEELSKWIKLSLNKSIQSKVPINRNTSYQFSEKHPMYPGVKYFGMWSNGLMHGIGRLEFLDGKVYNGLMKNSEIHGFGQMFTPNLGTYEGNFENGKYHGYGVLEMKNKERYKGNFKNGEFSGHGKLENDRFNYFGEFLKNMKYGYGVLDDKFNGSKYLGMFENNKKHGFGTLFTLEGDYFNGIFVDDTLIGDGLALLADGSFYRGELTLNGPNGKGVLYISAPKNDSLNIDDYKTLSITGRMMSGSFSGTWKKIKITNGILSTDIIDTEDIDIYNINPNKKWCSLFRDWENEVFNDIIQNYNNNSIWNKISVYISNSKRKEKLKSDGFEMKNQMLANKLTPVPVKKWNNSNYDSVSLISNLSLRSSSNNYSKRSTLDIKEKLPDIVTHKSISSEMLMMMARDEPGDNKKLTELENAQGKIKTKRIYHSNDSIVHPESLLSETRRKTKENILEISPNFGIKELTRHDIMLIKEYLNEAFKDLNHPLGVLITKISKCFYFSYGHWNNKKPTILTRQALDELESISIRIYQIIRRLFPALPEESLMLDDNEKISHRYFYPILLSNSIYSSLFVLYASKCAPLDEICQRRIRFTDKKSDEELMKFIKIEPYLYPIIKNHVFKEAIQNFRQVETKFCPKEMLEQIKMTYELINRACYETLGETFILNTDILLPLSIFLILRSNIPHIGAELLLLEDLLESEYELNGESGICFTHIKASYIHVISSNFFED